MHLRIFLSSPGDAAEERNLAQQVVEQELPKDQSLRGKSPANVSGGMTQRAGHDAGDAPPSSGR